MQAGLGTNLITSTTQLTDKSQRVSANVILGYLSRLRRWSIWIWYQHESLGKDTRLAVWRFRRCIGWITSWPLAVRYIARNRH